jgi:hypothetical protein
MPGAASSLNDLKSFIRSWSVSGLYDARERKASRPPRLVAFAVQTRKPGSVALPCARRPRRRLPASAQPGKLPLRRVRGGTRAHRGERLGYLGPPRRKVVRGQPQQARERGAQRGALARRDSVLAVAGRGRPDVTLTSA